ncbi:MAG TPA: phosphopantothenoylcysteine decarboxylase [Candidatus Thermoplasmatota archaeon]|nr:phosphopantothenoylcysteine decarboxylase [Candidatus Thermoplasmatota archaeon]
MRGATGAHLQGRTVALGVDAARGAPGAVRIARALVRLGAEVQPLLAPAAEAWVHPDALAYGAGRATMAWPTQASYDAVLLAPAGHDLLAKLRHRLPDTAPAAAALTHLGRVPVLVAPAPGAEDAADGLEAAGFRLARGAFDAHGEPRPEPLAARVAGLLSTSPLRGRRVLLVAGGAHEPLDAMRVVATRGDALLARALRLELERRGARVQALLGPAAVPHDRDERAYETLLDLGLMARLLGAHDLAVVEDALPALAPTRRAGKIASGQQGLALELHPAHAERALEGVAPAVVRYRSEGSAPDAQAARIANDLEARSA